MPEARAADAHRRDALVCAFNFLPSSYCDAGWLPPGLDAQQLEGRSDAGHPCHRYLSPWLLARLKVEGEFELAFDDPCARIALLDAAALSQLSAALGMLARHDLLRHTVQREAVQALKQASGIDDLRVLLAAPEHLRLLSPPGLPEDLGPSSLVILRHLGEGFLWSLMSCQSRAVRARFRLKSNPMDAERRLCRLVDKQQTPALAGWVTQQLLPRVLPQWAWLF